MIVKENSEAAREVNDATVFKVLGASSFSHFLNDTIQSLMLAIYPLFKAEFHLSFAQIGLIPTELVSNGFCRS